MTYNDIIEKFKIEYDKANVTSSYPSFTDYEICTILDKSYLNLIAQKFTGNNTRRAPFEADNKAISDLQQLVVTTNKSFEYNSGSKYSNVIWANLPEDFLYYVKAQIVADYNDASRPDSRGANLQGDLYLPIQLVTHDIAKRFESTPYNMPWIKSPVGYIENDKLYVLYDIMLHADHITGDDDCEITYVKKPESFVGWLEDRDSDTNFSLNDEMAEALISLAVTYSLENVESPRLNTHVGVKGLES